MDKPLVSVCVAVYNGEKYLHRMLASFLCQSLADSEVVFADNWSTDSTVKIIEKYQEDYPDRIRVLKTDRHYDFPAEGRYLAVKNARADYVYVCDADDEIDVRALEKLYNAATNYAGNHADVVIGSADCIKVLETGDVAIVPYKRYQNKVMTIGEAVQSGPEFWTKLIKKELFLEAGKVPEIVFDDAAYMPGLLSRAKSVYSISDVVYYYYRTEEGLSANGVGDSRITLESIKAGNYMLAHTQAKYKTYAEKHVAARLEGSLNTRWMYADYYLDELRKNYKRYLSNPEISSNTVLMNKLTWWYKTISDESVPDIVYLNGFTHKYTDEEIDELRAQVLSHECRMVVLNEENCDIDENPVIRGMYDSGRLREVVKYFGLKNVVETGGYFVDDCIHFNNPLNFCRNFNGFIGIENAGQYNDHIFGGVPGNELFKEILGTYNSQTLYQRGYTLAQRFRLILTSEYKFPYLYTSKSNNWSLKWLYVFTENYFTVSGFGKNICEIDYSALSGENPDDVICIRRSTIELMMSRACNAVHNEADIKTAKHYKEELDSIYNSNTWRYMMKLRKLGDTKFGGFLKKIRNSFRRKKAKA